MKKFLSVLLAVMMVLSTVSFAVPSAVVTVDTAVEAPVDAVEDAELSAVITDNTDHGELVFELNFDNLANGTTVSNGAKLNTLGATLSSNIAKANDLYLNLGGYASAVVENGALKAVKTSTDRWPQIQVSVGNKNSMVDNGIIYMEADMKVDLTDAQTCTVNLGLTGYREYLDGTSDAGSNYQTSVQTIYTAEEEKWYSLKGAYALNDADGINGLECVIFLPTYSGSSSEQDYFYIDNLRLYYKPFNAKVTLTSDADYLTLPEAFTVSTTESILVSELVKDVEKASIKYAITGVKIDGTEYAMTDSVVITKDCEVEVLSKLDTEYANEWLDDEHGILLFKTDFDSAAVGSIKITGTDNEDAAAFTATSEVNPYFSEYSSMVGTMLLGDAYAPENAEIVYDEVLESNVLKFTASQSYTGLMYSTPYNQRNKCDLINSSTGVLTIIHKLKAPVGATYRYNGWINNYPDSLTYNTGGDDSQDSYYSTDLGNGYYEWVGVYNMVDGFHIDSFKIHLAGATAGDVAYFDDIEVFWKPATANITFADCDVKGVKIATPALTNVATSTTVSALLTAAGVDYSEVSNLSYTFKGVSFDAEGTKVYGLNDTINFYENSTLYLVFEKVDMSEWIDPEKGILLFDITFDQNPAWTTYQYLTSCATLNPYFADTNYSNKWYIQTTYMDTQHTISNGEFIGTLDAGRQFPQILIQANHPDVPQNTFGGSGVYYVEADMYVSENSEMKAIGITPHKMINGTSTQSDGISKTMTDGMAGSYQTISGTIDASDCEGVSKIILLWTRTSASVTTTPTVKYDNVRLYWKPNTVDVTIEGGRNAGFETVTLEDVSTSATVDEIIAMLPGTVDDYGKLTGFADENGVKITSFSAVSDVTLQALWTPWNYIEGVGQEFATDGIGLSKSNYYSVNGDTNYLGSAGLLTYAYMMMYKNNEGYGARTENGNFYLKFRNVNAGDDGKLLHNSGVTDTYTVPGIAGTNIYFYYNAPQNENMTGYVIKYRYKNVPNLTEWADSCISVAADGMSATFTDRTGATQSFTKSPSYFGQYYLANGSTYLIAGGGYLTEGGTFTDGEWIYDVIPHADKTQGSTFIRFIPPMLWGDMEVEVDYIRAIGDGTEDEPIVPEQPAPEYAPTSSTETSCRTDYPKGIRFKADMTAETNAVAVEYGWVVGREAKGATEETLVIGAANSITAYGRTKLEGDIKNFFEETDELKTFTAVVYNIPTGNEDDVICIKPFVKLADDTVYYGEMISKTPRQVAEAAGVEVSQIMK